MNRKKVIVISVMALIGLSGCAEKESVRVSNLENDLCYITNFNAEDNTVELDVVEWLTLEDTERIDALQIDVDNDMPSGFYIYNEEEKIEKYACSEATVINVASPEGGWYNVGDMDDFSDYYVEKTTAFEDYRMFFDVTAKDGVIIEMSEVFLP